MRLTSKRIFMPKDSKLCRFALVMSRGPSIHWAGQAMLELPCDWVALVPAGVYVVTSRLAQRLDCLDAAEDVLLADPALPWAERVVRENARVCSYYSSLQIVEQFSTSGCANWAAPVSLQVC